MTARQAMRVVLYARVSTRGQAQDGHSLDAQVLDMQRYTDLYRLDVIEVVRDEGASARSLDRLGIARVRELIDSGSVDAVLVYKLDRLTRSLVDLGVLLEDFHLRKIGLLSVQEKLDTETAVGRFTVGIIGLLAQWSREDTGERTQRGLMQAQAAGKRVGRPPFGYLVMDGALVKHDEQQRVIRAMRRLHGRGESFASIARRMNARNIPADEGGPWYPATVRRVLTARRYSAAP